MLGRWLEALQVGIRRQVEKPRSEVNPGLTRGVVIRVFSGDESVQVTPLVPAQILCDVLLARGGIVRAPVMQRGSSVSNTSRWVPTPARSNMATGAAIKLTNDGVDPPPSSLDDLDGEVVLIDWLDGDIHRPVIVGSLEHPRGIRRVVDSYSTPTTAALPVRMHSDIAERYLAHQGTTARVDKAGNVRLDLRRAGIANDGRTYDANGEAAGVVDLSLRDGGELLVRGPAGLPILRVRAQGNEVLLDVGASPTERILLAGPTIAHLAAWEAAVNDLGARVSSLFSVVGAAALAADVSGAPAPVEVLPGGDGTLRQSWEWEPPQGAGEAALKAALIRVGSAVEE